MEVEVMKAYHIALFLICLNVAFPLLAPTGIFGALPGGVNVGSWLNVGAVVSALLAGGITWAGFSFKMSAAVSVFSGIYVGSSALMWTLLLQMHVHPAIITALGTVYAIVGIIALIQLATGPVGVAE